MVQQLHSALDQNFIMGLVSQTLIPSPWQQARGRRPASLVQQDGPEPVLLAHGYRGDGAIVELEGRPAVHHHAGVPAPRADAHPAGGAEEEAAAFTASCRRRTA